MIIIHNNIHILEDIINYCERVRFMIEGYSKLIEHDTSPTEQQRELFISHLNSILTHAEEIDKNATILHDAIVEAYEEYIEKNPIPPAAYFAIDKDGKASVITGKEYSRITPRRITNENTETLNEDGTPVELP